MKKIIRMMCLVAMGGACQLHAAEPVGIYQLFDMLGQSGYMILNKEAFAKLSAEIKEEEKAFPAAMAEAKKQWEENQTSVMKKADKAAKLPFPTARLKPRSIKKCGSDFTDLDLAKKHLAQMQSSAEKTENKAAATQRQNPTREDIEREELKARAFTEAVSLVNMQMAYKLGRPVKAFSFTTPEDPNKKF